MKKLLSVLMIVILVFSLTACGKSDKKADKKAAGKESKIDLDLSKMSGTAVYSEVLNMMQDPDKYKGKMVKITGAFDYYNDKQNNKEYFACIIQDATACCAQGFEFETKKKLKYPDDYPEVGYYVTVQGVFDSYKEGEMTYCILRDAEMV